MLQTCISALATSSNAYLCALPPTCHEHTILESPRQKKVNSVPVLEAVAAGVGFNNTGTDSVTANLSLVATIVKRKQAANFPGLLTRASSVPVLVTVLG